MASDSADPVDAAMAAASGSYAPESGDPVDAAMAAAVSGNGVSGPTSQPDRGHFSVPQALLRGGTGLLASVAGGLRGLWDLAVAPWGQKASTAAQDVEATQQRFTSSANPATQAGLASNWNPLTYVPKAAAWAGGKTLDLTGSPAAATAVETGLNALPMLVGGEGAEAGGIYRTGAELGAAGAKNAINATGRAASTVRNAISPPPTLEDIANRSGMQSPQSIGAAAASPVTQASPELAAGIRQEAKQTGGAVNPTVTARHVEADSLPVPIQLSEGQATRDPQLFSNEQNSRARDPAFAQQFNDQELKLTQNLRSIRDEAGPQVFSANPVEHGDTLIAAYQAKDAAAEADIGAKYQALRDAAGGEFPVDAGKILDNSSAALHKQLLFEHAPPSVMSQLQNMAANGMNFEQFEALRTNLATIQRTSNDGLASRAAGVIRNQMEQLPLEGGAANLKPLADAARSAAKAHFQELEADPAYAAAVDGSVPPDRFVQKFVTGGTRDNVALMAQNLAGDPVARQTMAVSAIDHLRQSAGIDSLDNGRFRQSGYNRQLQAFSPKLSSLVDPATAENLEKVGNVARNIQEQPAGAYVNTSNTLTAAMAEHAKSAGEHALNYAAGGIPIGTMARNALAKRAAAKQASQAFRPAAGVGRLSDIPGAGGSP